MNLGGHVQSPRAWAPPPLPPTFFTHRFSMRGRPLRCASLQRCSGQALSRCSAPTPLEEGVLRDTPQTPRAWPFEGLRTIASPPLPLTFLRTEFTAPRDLGCGEGDGAAGSHGRRRHGAGALKTAPVVLVRVLQVGGAAAMLAGVHDHLVITIASHLHGQTSDHGTCQTVQASAVIPSSSLSTRASTWVTRLLRGD